MNKLRIAWLTYTALLLAVSCGKEQGMQQPDGPEEEEKVLSLPFSDQSVSSTPTAFDVRVYANCDWRVRNDADWVSVAPDNEVYSSSMTLSVSVAENKKTESRSATLLFLYGDKQEALTIVQDAFNVYLEVSLEEISFGYRTAEKVIMVTSNCGWFAKSSETWTAIKPSTGLIGNFEMSVNVETNNSEKPRSAQIHIWNEEYELDRYVSIGQEGQPETEERDYVDEYGINRGKGEIIRGLTWAPVNCGYHEDSYPLGKLYQWGRKNGLGYQDADYQDATAPETAPNWSGSNGEEEADTFYKYADDSKFNYDWIKEGDDSYWNLGSEENPKKNGRFDPCPDGWRIPTAFEFKSLVEYVDRAWTVRDGMNGFLFSESRNSEGNEETASFFLPAGGRLNVVDGKAYDRNVEAYYWTISAREGSSAYLYFYEGDCSINALGSRAGGCLVRCVKE